MKKNFTAAQRSAMHKMSPARRAAFQSMLSKAPSIASLRRRPNRSKPTAKPKKKAVRRARGPAVSVHMHDAGYSAGSGFVSPVVVTPGFAYPAAALRHPPKREFLAAEIEKGKSYTQAQAAWKRAYGRGKAPKRKPARPRAYGAKRQIHPLRVTIGTRTRQSYLYRTRRGKTRRVPEYAILGYPSAYAMKLEMSTRRGAERGLKKKERLQARRERSATAEAKRIRAGRGLFTPNAGATMNWQEWRDMYKTNKRRTKKARKGRKLTKAQRRAISIRNLRKAWGKGKRRHAKRTTKRTHARRHYAENRGAAPRKHKLTKAQRSAAAKKGARKRRARLTRGPSRRKMGKWARIRGRKSGTRRMTFPTAGARHGAITLYPNGTVKFGENRKRRSRGRKHYDENRKRRVRRHYASNRKMARYDSNRRRHRSRRYRSNATAWVGGLKEALKIGGIVIVGFLVHRSLSRVISEQAAKLDAFADGTTLGNWREVIAGLLVAAVGVPLAVRFVPSESAAIGGGIAASFLHGLILRALSEAGQAKVAGYLSAYPDATGPAYPGIGSYYKVRPRQMRGMSEYYSQKPGLRMNQLRQPAAGFGANRSALVTQAAAGEFLAFGATAQGGDYSEVPMLPMPTVTNDGVLPTLDAAEQALNVMEAAAGVGASEIPMQSDLYPEDQQNPIGDEPGGSRSGIFSGGGGIFGG